MVASLNVRISPPSHHPKDDARVRGRTEARGFKRIGPSSLPYVRLTNLGGAPACPGVGRASVALRGLSFVGRVSVARADDTIAPSPSGETTFLVSNESQALNSESGSPATHERRLCSTRIRRHQRYM